MQYNFVLLNNYKIDRRIPRYKITWKLSPRAAQFPCLFTRATNDIIFIAASKRTSRLGQFDRTICKTARNATRDSTAITFLSREGCTCDSAREDRGYDPELITMLAGRKWKLNDVAASRCPVAYARDEKAGRRNRYTGIPNRYRHATLIICNNFAVKGHFFDSRPTYSLFLLTYRE